MTKSLIGFDNKVLTGTLSATNQRSTNPVSFLQNSLGDTNSAWRTEDGVKAASFTINSGDSATKWRAFLLSRTNLTAGATIRWTVGSAEGVVPETPAAQLDFKEGYAAPTTGTYTFTRATTSWRRRVDGVWEEVASGAVAIHHDASGNCLGMLAQRTITNLIRNARLEGGVVGAPGTLPTNNATVVGGTGAASSVATVSITEDGLPCFDWRISGTVTVGGTAYLYLETTTGIAAVQNDTIWQMIHARLASGGLTNITSVKLGYEELTGAGAFLARTETAFTPSSLRLGAQRPENSGTMGQATAANVRPYIAVTYGTGAVDLTLRLGVPLLSKGTGYVSAVPITPVVATPATSTRNVDVLTWLPGVTLMAGASMTGYVQAAMMAGFSGANASVLWDDNSGNNRIQWRGRVSGGNQGSDVVMWNAATLVVDTADTISTTPVGVLMRNVITISRRGFKRWLDTYSTDTDPDTMTTSATRMAIDQTNLGAVCVRDMRVYAKRLTDAQCLQLATDGTSYDSSQVVYDSGLLASGVLPDTPLSLHIAPQEYAGQYARCDISDPLNAAGSLTVPLAYAGPVWAPLSGVSWGSGYQLRIRQDSAVTRGGQEHIDQLSIQKNWSLVFEALPGDDLWLYQQAIEAIAAKGDNLLFVPDRTSSDITKESIYGLMRDWGFLNYPLKSVKYRGWQTRVYERL